MSAADEAAAADGSGRASAAGLPLAALGVVYGDIGTSPLYALRECFFGERAVAITEANVLGILSLVTWALLLIISLKYLGFILRADHDGEGGILALMELVKRRLRGRLRAAALAIGLFGAALLYGDGMITPAISVLSAVEGLEVAAPGSFDGLILPVTAGILSGLFVLQRLGTGGIGKLFGPIMLLWFSALAVAGGASIWQFPQILQAVSPVHAAVFLADHGAASLAVLGVVFLVVTGGEALYADLGHLGRRPIVTGWYTVVLPSLLLNYFGQGALILAGGSQLEQPFYELFPDQVLYPMVGLATAATIIASQAIISGVFSLSFQAIQLGYLPRLRIRHTSPSLRGQIYIGPVNWLLMAATLGLVLAFRSSGALAGAYGIAIAATMAVTTILFAALIIAESRWPIWLAAAAVTLFLVVDSVFLLAASSKITSGGWLPLLVAGCVMLIMTTWHRGRQIEKRAVRDRAQPVREFLAARAGNAYRRVPGQAVYLTRSEHGTPFVLMRNLEHNRALHRRVVIYTPKTVKRPFAGKDRIRVRKLRDDIFRVVACHGFMESVDVPTDLDEAIRLHHLPIDLAHVTYFYGDEIALAREGVGMSWWRARLFAFLQRTARRGPEDLSLPPDRVIEIGTQVPL